MLVNHFIEDSSEDKRQECQCPQEPMRMKMQAMIWKCKLTRVRKEILHYEMERTMQLCYDAYIIYASAKFLQSSNVKSYSIMLACVCVYEKWGVSPPFKEKWMVRDNRQNIWSRVELKSGSNPCAQVSSNEKKESVDFWEWRMSGGELKLF